MHDVADLAELGGDGLLVWAAQGRGDGGPGTGVRAWRLGSALAVASPNPQLDRLIVSGAGPDALALARRALAEVGPSYRLLAAPEVVVALARDDVPGLAPLHRLYWMDTQSLTGAPAPGVGWLDAEQEKAALSLFDRFFPLSLARPGGEGVRRWAGIVEDGEPLAVGADAWSAASCGFVSGVFTHPAARGRGLARAVCAFLLNALTRRHGRAGLLVFAENAPAIATYERLGMTKRPLAAAEIRALLSP
ncbi:GNAT family N-acetyltransferase [Streptomyces sp. 6N223]|uniref:GNAT family N-acetyltransferase n=1 Tax=Streptomyces sp. 6N223 TaxID=3457412 RepID=UPI003FD658AE